MSTRIHDNLNLGKKALLDARLAPVADYASLPDPNLPSNYIPEGATILVQDTNKNYQAQIDVGNPTNLIWIDISTVALSGTGVAFIDITYSNLAVLAATNNLSKGAFYRITDRADLGIIVQALDISIFSTSAQGVFLVPDYGGIGTYGTTPVVFGSQCGVWNASSEASMSNGDVVIWNGSMYQVQSSASFAGTDPVTNTLAYILIPKSIRKGYILQVDDILYNFSSDYIISRSDKRNNVINGIGVSLFQWGNDAVSGNVALNSAKFDCINNRGYIQDNVAAGSVTVACGPSNIGNILGSYFHSIGYTFTCNTTVPGNTLLNNCRIVFDENITFIATESYTSKFCELLSSSFEYTADLSTLLSGTILTLPTGLNYIGVIKLQNNSGSTITKILNTPKFRFRVQVVNGNNQNMTNTAVSTAVAGEMIADVVGINNIIGRTGANDFIEYERLGTGLLRRYNIVKLA